MATHKTVSEPIGELVRLEAKRKELEDRIALIQERQGARLQLMAFVKKQGYHRGDLVWVWQQLPAMRLTRAARLKRVAEKHGAHAMKQDRKQDRPKKYQPKPELIPLGKRIHELRLAKKMSAVELGEKVGKHPSMVTGWERGMWRIKADVLVKLEKALGGWLKNPPANEEKK